MMYEEKFQSELLDDEKLIWIGKPDTKATFSKGDVFLIPFSILWGGGTIYFFFFALKEINKMPVFFIIQTFIFL